MNEREQLQQAIAQLEDQRAVLGDTALAAALAGLRQKLDQLDHLEMQRSSATSPPALVAERKLVTVMFADISGFTALSERMDPEAVREMMNGCFERMVPIIEGYGGTVDKFLGDEIMALFGAPVTHENDPERAVRAALQMIDEMNTFNGEHGVNLGWHFGINTGLVIAGDLGAGKRQEYSVIGDTVNLASRLEDASERGQILVGHDTYRLTVSSFEFETLGPIKLKGKAESVPVFRVLGAKAKPKRVRSLTIQGIISPLVGRDTEFAAVNDRMKDLVNGQGGIVSIVGEAGVGKSRLIAEIRKDAPAKRVYWLESHTLSYGQTISYWPFQEILWQFAGITDENSETEAWQKLESRVTALFAENSVEVLPYLASLLMLEVRGEYAERVKYLDGEAMHRQVFLATRRFFEKLAQAQPVALVFEDLHWVDESSALLLEHLLPLVERVPLLICGISRPDPQTPAARLREIIAKDYASRYTEIRLTPLSRKDSAQLVQNLLESEILSPRMREMIVSKAEGNPFFLEEIILSLIDAGVIVRDPASGRWQTTAQVEQVTIPDTIHGVVMARVDRLDEDLRQVLKMAAVIGRSFLYRILHVIAEADRELDQHLADLQAIEIIREKQRIPELEYIFKHALAQEATYESILLQKRRELHKQVGQAIETLFADRLEEFSSLLAYHYARAEAWEKAHDYLLKAGDQAGRVAADTEALVHYQQALAAYERAFGAQWEPLQRAVLERKMGEAFFRRGQQPQAFDYLQRALAILGKPLPASLGGVRLAIMQELARQAAHRLFPGLLLKPLCNSVTQAVEEEVRLNEFIGWIDAFQGNERFLLVSLRTLNVSESCGYPYGVATGSMGLGSVGDLVPAFRLAGWYHRRAVALAEKIQHPAAIGLAYVGLTHYHLCLGEWNATIEDGLKGANVYRGIGNLHSWGYATYMVAFAQANIGDFAQALEKCREIIRLGQEGADIQVRCWGLWTQGFVLRSQGKFDEAIAALREAKELAEATQDYVFCIDATDELGRCYLRQGKLEQALATLEANRQFCAEHPTKALVWLPYPIGLAEAYLLAAERGIKSEQSTWLKKAERACQDSLKRGQAYSGLMPAAMRLKGTWEWLKGNRGPAQQLWERSLALAEKMGQRHESGMTLLEMGQRLDERKHLERAEVLFGEIGAEWDLARARESLEEYRLPDRIHPGALWRKRETEDKARREKTKS